MNKQIKQSILSGLAFSGTILFSYMGFAVWSDLPTQNNNSTLTADIWNQMITTVNNIGKSQLGVDQTRQDVLASRSSRASIATATQYTNTTGKPIIVSVYNVTTANQGRLVINGVVVTGAISGVTGIVPNGASYSIVVTGGVSRWFEFR